MVPAKAFGTDIKIFEETAMAELMLLYTANMLSCTTLFCISMNGGGGFEICNTLVAKLQNANFTLFN